MSDHTSPQILCIYHANCADGFGAAWAVRERFGAKAEYFAATHSDPPPDVRGRDVIMVDFAYKPDVLREMSRTARSILVLDHHKSAEQDLPHETATDEALLSVWRMDRNDFQNRTWEHFRTCVEIDRCENLGRVVVYALFDMNRSGAGLAWDFFHPGKQRPRLIDHIEDRDLWRFALPGTREVQACLFSYPYDFDVWTGLMYGDASALVIDGAAIERKHHKDIAELLAVCRRRMLIAGFDVPVASLPYTLTSDAGERMARGEAFAACYWDTAEHRCFSLRASAEGLDVSEIAREYGGGGHAKAAGFRVPRDHALAIA